MNISTLPNSPKIATLTPSQLDIERLSTAADATFARLTEEGLVGDQGKAYDLMATAGNDLFAHDPSFRLGQELFSFVLGNTPHEVLVVKLPPVPEEELAPTPNYHPDPANNPVLKLDVPRGLLLGATGLVAYGYTSQQPGNITNNIVAIPEMAGVPGVSANAYAALGLHTEDASYNKHEGELPDGSKLTRAHDASPDVLTLHFLRNEHHIPTTVSAPNLYELPLEVQEMLRKPYFMNLTNESQGGSSNDIPVPVSIVYGDQRHPQMRVNASRLIVADKVPVSDRAFAKAALGQFLELLEASTVRLESAPGDLIFILNKHAAHGRAEYPANMPDSVKYGPTARWQRRVVAVHDDHRHHLEPLQTAHRIIDPKKLHDQIRQHR